MLALTIWRRLEYLAQGVGYQEYFNVVFLAYQKYGDYGVKGGYILILKHVCLRLYFWNYIE